MTKGIYVIYFGCMNFGENLKKIREESNLSQQDLARKLDVAQSTIAMWESSSRTPKLSELNRLAQVLKITVNRLIGQPRDKKVEVLKNEIYIDGEKISDLDATDVDGIVQYIDAVKKKKGALPKTPPPAMKSSAKKILIIDDEQEICEMLYSLIGRAHV